MALSFRQRIFGWLVAIAVVPAAIAVALSVLAPQFPIPGGAQAWEEAAATFRDVRARVDTSHLSPGARLALGRHNDQLNNSVRYARRAQRISGALSGIVAAVTLALVVLVLGGAVLLAGHLSRQLSRPIDELVTWTGLIKRGAPIPTEAPARGAPEFDALREGLKTMASELSAARSREVEAAELRAFRELAKNVAHELKNPLTPIRFAIERLARDMKPEQAELFKVLESESERIEQMAREFAELGRVPSGPTSEVDLGEMLEELAKSHPDKVAVRVERQGTPIVRGYYEQLHRAVRNLVNNAIEADRTREVVLGVRPLANGGTPSVEITVSDNGEGIPPDVLARVFEPHFTTKSNGTGLGLAIVKQTISHHRGTIAIASEPGRGTTVTIVLPNEGPGA